MPTPTAQLLSRTVYTADGVTTNWNFSFSGGYIDPAHIEAFYVDPLDDSRTFVDGVLVGTSQFVIEPAVPAGMTLTIARNTPKDLPLVDFVEGGSLTELALDTANKQAIFGIAELLDTAGTADVDAAVAASGSAEASAISAAASAASALASASALYTGQSFTFTSVGAATFTLGVTPEEINTSVYIQGVYQNRNTYSITGGVLTLDAAPVVGAVVEVSVGIALNSAVVAGFEADAAMVAASVATTSAAAASASASASTATTQAGLAQTAATSADADAIATAADRVQTGLDRAAASASASAASSSAGTAATAASTATSQAGNASSSASTASTAATTATTQASSATASASTATTQAGIATTKAGEANSSAIAAAASAASISGGPVASVNGMTGVVTGVATLTAVQTLTNKTLTGYTETVYALSGTVIDPANGTVQTKTLAANTTFTESLADGQSVVLMLNPATFTTTWPTTSWVNAAGSAAAPTLKASVVNVIVLWQVAGVLYGNWIGSM